jgi:hypothetical protein
VEVTVSRNTLASVTDEQVRQAAAVVCRYLDGDARAHEATARRVQKVISRQATERAHRVREEARRLGVRLPSLSPLKLLAATGRSAKRRR